MLFNTLRFGLFFTAVFALWWGLSRWHLVRLTMLLAASMFFYACWDWRYLFLLLGVTAFDWAAALLLERTTKEAVRKAIVAIVCVGNLGVLAYWKYSNFFLDTISPLLTKLGVSTPHLQLILPIGISFYSFQGLGYVVDVYRGEMKAVRSLPKFFLVKAFFPQLVAGPIVRPKVLIPQFDAPKALDSERLSRALTLILLGLLKKAMADYLAQNLVDRVFDLPEHYSTLESLGAIYGYAFQIYGDFSGYTDVAIGAALLLGFDLPPNFNLPYRSQSLREFWRRWHISLSSWLRDYLYIPLGGSRGGFWFTQRNLFLTMLLGGLWHGASWNFVIWGAMHGGGLVVERLWERLTGRSIEPGAQTSWPSRVVRTVLTFHVVSTLWVFFRAETFTSAVGVLRQVFVGGAGTTNLSNGVLGVLGLSLVLHFVPDRLGERLSRAFERAPALVHAAAIIGCFYGLRALSGAGTQPFIYFQF
jgi:D-alanyl-lipoteichoic acid acyltransferase DltB (MBOAT superfamily)